MRGGVRRSGEVVGRGPDLERLRRVCSTAAGGGSDCVVVTGEAGVGKSRLLAETVVDARRRGVTVLTGRASVAAPVSFGVVAEAVRSWLRGAPSQGRDPSVYDPGLHLIVPEWPGGAAATGMTDAQLRLLALEGLVDLVGSVADGRGLLVVLDDLHWADAESVEAMRYLATAGLAHVGIVAALRRSESSVVDRVVDDLAHQGFAERWSLEPLLPLDVADLVAALVASEPPRELIEDITARAGGVPLFVEELVDAHLRFGSVSFDAQRLRWRGGAAVVPGAVASLVAGRLDRFTQPERDVLVAASITDADDLDLLAAVSGQPLAIVRSAVAGAIEAGLLETIARRVEFRHAIVRDAIREQALPDDVRTMHARAAQALNERAPDETTLERIAHHVQSTGDDDGAAVALTRAAEVAARAHASLRAEQLASRARDLANSLDIVSAADDVLAEALAAQGRWTEALAVDRSTVASSGLTPTRWMRMARCALDARDLGAARELAERIELVPDARSPYVDVTRGRLALAAGDVKTTLALVDTALAIAASSDPACACAALDLRARAHVLEGRRLEAVAAWEEQQRVAGESGLTAERLRGLVSLAELELFEGAAPVRMVEAVEVAREAGALVEQVWAQLNLAIALTVQGDPIAGAQVADEAAECCRRHRLDLLPYVLMARAGASHLLGDPTFDDRLAEARTMAGNGGDAVVYASGIAADHHLHLGHYDQAITEHQRVTDVVLAEPGGLPADSPHWLVLALAAGGRDDEARAALDIARQHPGGLRWPTSAFLLRLAEAVLAGDETAADAALAAATERMPFDAALARVLAAEILGGDHAARWLREALDLYEAHDGHVAIDRVRLLLRRAGGTVPRRRRRKDHVPSDLIGFGITAREAEVLALVRDGLSNTAIADKLFLSIRTVESHVSSLLAKLGAASRAQLDG